MGRVTDTISGGIATFRTPYKQDIRSLKAYFTPVQEGEGTPSPENVRAIRGWTGVEVEQAGKNLVPLEVTRRYRINGSGEIVLNADDLITDYIPIIGGAIYTFSTPSIFAGNERNAVYDKDKNYISVLATKNTADPKTYTMPSNACYIRLTLRQADYEESQFELGSTATAYEPYNGTTLPIDWSSVGTVYGGYVDLVTGEVWETHRLFDCADYLTTDSDIEMVNGNLCRLRLAKFSNQATWNNGICETFAPFSGSWAQMTTASGELFMASGNYAGFSSSTFGFTTKQEWLDYLTQNHVKFCAKLQEPVLLTTLIPTALRTLIGTNNIWCNSGDVSVEYDFAESWEMKEARKRVMGFDAAKRREGVTWDYEYYPNANGMILPEENIYVEQGQRVTISWKTTTDTIYTNRYVWRCIGARFDGATSSYMGLTMSQAPKEDTRTYEVTQSGRFIAGNYVIASGQNPENTAFIGDYIKVRIE